MEVNSEKIHMLKGISFKRVLRMNCPRGLRSNSTFSPILVCIGLAALIITHSLIINHSRYDRHEQTKQTTIMAPVKSATASTSKLLLTTAIIDKNRKVAEIIKPYDWVRDDFFSPHKGKVITKNERKYNPQPPLGFKNVKSEPKKLKNDISYLKKDKENNINTNLDDKLKSSVGPEGVLKSLLGPNSIFESFSKGETGSNPGGALLGLVAAGVKQWQEGASGNNQVKKQPHTQSSSSSNKEDNIMKNKSSLLKRKYMSSNDVKTDEPIIQKEKNSQGSGKIPVRSSHKENNPMGSALSNIAPLAGVLMKQMVKPSNSNHKPPSLAESLMGDIGPMLLQNAIGKLTNPSDDEEKRNSPVNSLMGNLGPILLKNAIGRLANPTGDENNGPISPVQSLVQNLGPVVLQGMMGGVGRGGQEHADKPFSPVQSLVQNIGPIVLQGIVGGVGRGGQEHADKPISQVESLVRNLGPAVLQGVMNGGGRGEQGQQPSGFMSIIAKAAPKLLNGFLSGGMARSEDRNKSQPKQRHIHKQVAFADHQQQSEIKQMNSNSI